MLLPFSALGGVETKDGSKSLLSMTICSPGNRKSTLSLSTKVLGSPLAVAAPMAMRASQSFLQAHGKAFSEELVPWSENAQNMMIFAALAFSIAFLRSFISCCSPPSIDQDMDIMCTLLVIAQCMACCEVTK